MKTRSSLIYNISTFSIGGYAIADYLLVAVISDRHLFPTMQRLRQGDFVYFNQLPISLGENAMTNAARGKDRANVLERLPQTVAHLVYVIPLLFRHRGTHIVGRHLGLVE